MAPTNGGVALGALVMLSFVLPWFRTTMGGNFTPMLMMHDGACAQLGALNLKPTYYEQHYNAWAGPAQDDDDDANEDRAIADERAWGLGAFTEGVKGTLRDLRDRCDWPGSAARTMSLVMFGSTESPLRNGMALAVVAALLTVLLHPAAAIAWLIGLALIYQNAWGVSMDAGFWVSIAAAVFALARSQTFS